jgi:ubiquinone/menaquinone biosynthesis C-methylase UbiE
VLNRLPDGARLLDVGVGTAGALLANAELVREKRMQVVGVDIDPDYVRQAQRRVAQEGLSDLIDVHQCSILDFEEQGFDAVYFSCSFMLMPDPGKVLEHVQTLLKPDGVVYFTQTFEERRAPFIEKLKPLLYKLTTIHFGQVTYEDEFMKVVEGAGMNVREQVRLGRGRARAGRLVVAVTAEAGAHGSAARREGSRSASLR